MKSSLSYFIGIFGVLGVVISILFALALYKDEQLAVRHQYIDEQEAFVARLEQELVAARLMLFGVRAIYRAANPPSQQFFSDYVEALIATQPAIEGLAYATKSSNPAAQELPLLERIYPPDTFRESKVVSMLGGRSLEQYFSGAEGEAAVSVEAIEINEGRRWLMMLPVAQDPTPPRLDQDHSPSGMVLGILDMRGLVDKILEELHFRTSALQLIGVSEEGSGTRLYFKVDPQNDTNGFLKSASFQGLNGHDWYVQSSPSDNYFQLHRGLIPEVALLAGLALTGVIMYYLLFIARRAQQIQGLVDRRTKELHEANRKLELLTLTDALTGLANRRGFDEAIQVEWSRAQRDHNPLTLLLADVDYFKAFNDYYGHPAGDECLRQVAGSIASVPGRLGDLVARYGGEEFAVILPNTEDPDMQLANKCLEAVAKLRIAHEPSLVAPMVTVSVGMATMRPEQQADVSELINKADRALYQAKESGRNQTAFSD